MDQWPGYLTLPLAARYISVSEQTFENWVERGLLPAPRKPAGGLRLWKRTEIEKAMDRLARQEERAPLSRDDIERATREAAARH